MIQQELKKGRKLAYEDEALILIKSIRVNTISKLTYADAFKYEALQTDMLLWGLLDAAKQPFGRLSSKLTRRWAAKS